MASNKYKEPPKTFDEFNKIYTAQIKIGNVYNYLLDIQYYDGELLELLKTQCIFLANQLGGGYFTDAHWLIEPLNSRSAYHLYCLQMIKE